MLKNRKYCITNGVKKSVKTIILFGKKYIKHFYVIP